jgi:glycosyltransferase involved in cell wall biosynthesis
MGDDMQASASRSERTAPLLSVIIPVYNEEETVAKVIEGVLGVDLPSVFREIIVVDDGSTDATPRIIREARERHPWLIKVCTHAVNRGKGAAIHTGLSCASGEIAVLQDADLELDPRECNKVVQPILSGAADVVYGSRFLERPDHVPWHTWAANRFLVILTNVLFGSKLTDMETGYKAFRLRALEDMDLTCVGFDFEPEITANFLTQGYRIHEVPVSYRPRSTSEGKKIGFLDGIRAVRALFRCWIASRRP